MQIGTLTRFHRVRPRSGFRLTQKEVTIAASQTIKKYDLIKRSASGNTFEQALSLPGSDGGTTSSAGTTAVYGVAASAITTGVGGSETTTGRTTIPVWILDDGIEYCMRLYDGTAENADPENFTLGTNYQFVRYRVNASDWFYALSTTATNGELTYVDVPTGVEQGDNYGPVWVRIAALEAARAG